MLQKTELEIAPLDLQADPVAQDVHRVWHAAYAVEAQWLGIPDFPPLRMDVNALRAAPYRFLGARLHGQLLGLLATEDLRPHGELRVAALAVDPVHHGRGIAGQLLAALLLATDADRICTQTAVANAAARMAYGRMGFLWHRPFTLGDAAAGEPALPMVELRWQRRRIGVNAPLSIRRLAPHEHPLHRALRLRALRQDADAYEEAAATVAAWSDERWQAETAAVTAPAQDALLIADLGGRVCGCVYVRAEGEPCEAGAGARGVLTGLWVDPGQRRKGIARSLLQAACERARTLGLSAVHASLPAHRQDARATFRALGFVDAGRAHDAERAAPGQRVEVRIELAGVLGGVPERVSRGGRVDDAAAPAADGHAAAVRAPTGDP